MTETPRELAETIVEGLEAWVDRDAVTVSAAYLELLAALREGFDAYYAGDHVVLLNTERFIRGTPAPVSYRVSDRDAQQNADQHDIQAELK